MTARQSLQWSPGAAGPVLAGCDHLHNAFGPGCPYCTRPASPCCRKPLEGAPVVYRCTGCGHDVHGSVIDREYHPTPGSVAGRCSAQVPVPRHGQTVTAPGGAS